MTKSVLQDYYTKKSDFKFWGHNCFSITNGNSVIVIDPWFSISGAFYSSWFQYPKNHHLKDSVLNLFKTSKRKFIFISHEHQDHYDKDFLNLVPKDIKILIPNYSDKDFKNEISKTFKNVIELDDSEEFVLDKDINVILKIKDIGITHDSSILIKTKDFVFFNQNDCKVFDRLSSIKEKIDFYSVQFSGANWHPSNFNYSEEKKLKISSEKVLNKFKNVMNALNELKPTYFLPSAGPAIFPFLDTNYSLGVGNIFVHQKDLKEYLEKNGFKNTLFLRPGDSFETEFKEPIKTPTLNDLDLYKKGLKNKWKDIPDNLNRVLLEEQIKKRFSRIFDIQISNCPILIFNFSGKFDKKNSNMKKIFIDLENKKLLDSFDYSSKFEEIVSTEKYFNLMCYERWQNVYLTLRAKVYREPDLLNNDINIFLFSDYSNIRNNFLSTYSKEKEKIIVKNKNGESYLINKHCPHQKANLSNAEIDCSNNLICPVHAWKFDLNNGGKDRRSNLTIEAEKI